MTARFETVVGLLDTSATMASPALAEKLRDFTIAWCRLDYAGPIYEAGSVDELLRRAAQAGHRYCAVQAYGHIMTRHQDLARGVDTNFLRLVDDWCRARELLVAGEPEGAGLRTACFIVDLHRYRALDMPAFGPDGQGLRAAAERCGQWHPIAEPLTLARFDLTPSPSWDIEQLERYRGEGIFDYEGPEHTPGLSRDCAAFLDEAKNQAKFAKNGVFLANFEDYADLRRPPAGFEGPVDTFLGVAAGFKPNRTLEVCGFDATTRVVFFDYSRIALDIKRALIERWNGRGFVDFVRSIAAEFPDAFYQLWGDGEVGALDLELIERVWLRELDMWGGADALARHWARYRELDHTFLRCDLYRDPSPILAELRPSSRSIMWWSNAFHSVNSSWFYSRRDRVSSYRDWVRAVSEANPRLRLYGKDVNNLDLGGAQARDCVDLDPDAI